MSINIFNVTDKKIKMHAIPNHMVKYIYFDNSKNDFNMNINIWQGLVVVH